MNLTHKIIPLKPPVFCPPPQQTGCQPVRMPVSTAHMVPVYNAQPFNPAMSNTYVKESHAN